MKNKLFTLIFSLTTAYAYTQNLPSASGVSNNIIGHSAFIEAYDHSGQPLTEVNKKITGTTVLNENWGKGHVVLENGFLLNNVELQFDLFANELHFRKDSIAYAFVDALKEFSFEFRDDELVKTVTFRSGYPAIQKKNGDAFYQVLADGPNAQFLNYISKEVREDYVYGGPVKKTYKINEVHYIYDAKTGDIRAFNMNKPP